MNIIIKKKHGAYTHISCNSDFIFQRHGSFVWNELSPNEAECMIQKYGQNSSNCNNNRTQTNGGRLTTSATSITIPNQVPETNTCMPAVE